MLKALGRFLNAPRENFHRAELTVAERASQIAEYAKLAKEKRDADKTAQVAWKVGAQKAAAPTQVAP
jgi:hypothetical protein